MRGLVFEGPEAVAYRQDLPEPVLEDPGDAVVAVRRAGLCGSDLHPYTGREAARPGVVPGHEAVGDVLVVGEGVRRIDVGDRVVVPFTTSCGACAPCRAGLSARCTRGALFGWGSPADGAVPLHGAQAELVRVPLADGSLVRVPTGLGDVEALLLTDNLPTGWYAVERAGLAPGEPLVVVGLGAVGLCAVAAARALGAGRVVGVDPVAGRREQAERLGAVTASPEDACAVLDAAVGEPVAAVVEAAGTAAAQRLAVSLLRPGGTLSLISVQTGAAFAVTPVEAYDANLTIRVGRAPVRSVLDRLLPRVADGSVAIPDLVVTHPAAALADGPQLYRRFAAREPGMTKVAFVVRP